MSILRQVIEDYAISENLEALTDKTDKRASVSSVSEWSEDFQKQFPDAEAYEVPAILDSIRITRMREAGVVPDHYTSSTECKHCGIVPIFEGVPSVVKKTELDHEV